MDRVRLLELYDDELRRQAPFFDDQMRLEHEPPVVRLIGATSDPGNNCVLYSQLDEKSAGSVIDREVAYFQSQGRGFEWKLHDHDQPPRLGKLLLERGFVAGEPEEILAIELAAWPGSQPDGNEGNELPSGYTVHPVQPTESLQSIMQVQRTVWPDFSHDWLEESLERERKANPDAIRFYAVWHEGNPVSGGWMRLHGRFASFFGGSTLVEHRRRGLYRALLSARLHKAQKQGASFALVDAGPMSRPLLKGWGFFSLTGTTPYIR